MFPFTSTLRQYGGIRLRVQSRPESPMLKFNNFPLDMQTLPWAGIDLVTYGLQEKRLDLSPREVRYFS